MKLSSIITNKEFVFVKFPIIFPLIYGLILISFPTFETFLIFFTILLLAEPHFGATWPFFINECNYDHIKKNKVSLVYTPIIIIVLSLLGFIFFNKIFYLIFFAVNMYHVTRQSFGISKLYSIEKKDIKFQETLIYIFNILFFLIGYFRFFLNIDFSAFSFFLNAIIILSLIISSIVYLFKFGLNQNLFTFITGCIIFYPVCFVENPVHVILMGVTMHFSQYLFLTNKIVTKRENVIKKEHINLRYSKYFIFIIVIYGTLMAALSMFGNSETTYLKSLIIIPIIGQMLHFYLDSQLWKFSVKHNRENVLNFL